MSTSHIDHQTWFRDWLSRAWPRLHALISNDNLIQLLPLFNLVGIITVIAGSTVALLSPKRRAIYIFTVNDIGHLILLILVLFFFLPRLGFGRPYYKREQRDSIGRAIGEFRMWVILLVILWLCFYAARAFADAPRAFGHFGQLEAGATYVADYINILSAFPFFGLYMTAEYSAGTAWRARERLSLPFAVIIFGSIVQIVAHVSPTDERKLLAGIVNGLIVGLATALLVGRLDSKYVGLHKAVIVILYGYALIQPLFPYVFRSALINEDHVSAILVIQHSLVAAALVMKSVFLLTVGKIIDTPTLHFYMSSMQWVDKHIATLRKNHETALTSAGQADVEPFLFVLVPPDSPLARLNIEKEPDVRVQIAILNAWHGLSWKIEEFHATQIQISEANFNVRKISVVGNLPISISEENRFVKIELRLDLDLDSKGLKAELRKDLEISHAISQDQKTKQIKVIIDGLRAYEYIDGNGQEPHWHRLESVDLSNRLLYAATLELGSLK